MKRKSKTLFLTQFSILLALEAIFCFTPLGSLPIGPIVATLGMVPVIVTALLLGTGAGSLMGFVAGLFSFVVWSFMPPPTSAPFAFVFTPLYSFGEIQGNFWSVLICFVPRILVGTVAGLVFAAMKRVPDKLQWLRYGLSGLLGSLINTVGVLGGVWLFFGDLYASLAGASMGVILMTTLTTNGLLEAVISFLTGVFICMPLKKALSRSRG